MKINKTGCTRIVIELKHVVIKIPNFSYSWQHFLKGLLSNMQERSLWDINKDVLLCPVIWTMWGGWILVMKKADMKRHEEEVRGMPFEESMDDWQKWKSIYYKKWIDCGYGGDDKADNYGYYQDRLVKVDYGQ